jgi:hypothetical protein
MGDRRRLTTRIFGILMLRKPSATPRKQPKQERSQATKEALLFALAEAHANEMVQLVQCHLEDLGDTSIPRAIGQLVKEQIWDSRYMAIVRLSKI